MNSLPTASRGDTTPAAAATQRADAHRHRPRHQAGSGMVTAGRRRAGPGPGPGVGFGSIQGCRVGEGRFDHGGSVREIGEGRSREWGAGKGEADIGPAGGAGDAVNPRVPAPVVTARASSIQIRP